MSVFKVVGFLSFLIFVGCQNLPEKNNSRTIASTKIKKIRTKVKANVSKDVCEIYGGTFSSVEDTGPAGGFNSFCKVSAGLGKTRDLNCNDMDSISVEEKDYGPAGNQILHYCARKIPRAPFYRRLQCADHGGRVVYENGPAGPTTHCVFDPISGEEIISQ